MPFTNDEAESLTGLRVCKHTAPVAGARPASCSSLGPSVNDVMMMMPSELSRTQPASGFISPAVGRCWSGESSSTCSDHRSPGGMRVEPLLGTCLPHHHFAADIGKMAMPNSAEREQVEDETLKEGTPDLNYQHISEQEQQEQQQQQPHQRAQEQEVEEKEEEQQQQQQRGRVA
ncbi:unnamed protein product, partial [Pylaiella littoralis]